MAGIGAGIAAACLPALRANAGLAANRAPLSRALSALKPEYDVLVIGSGYGGAISAARLATGRSLALFERGREWQPAEFPSSLSSVLAQFRSGAAPLGLFDYRIGATLDVLSGSGLGGTSLINANVVIAPDRDVFDARWPAAIRAEYASGAMSAHESRVRGMLAVDTVGDADALRKHWFHASTTRTRARAGAGAVVDRLPIAVNLRQFNNAPNAQGVVQQPCAHCGDCVSGCRYGAKNTLDVNYLAAAKNAGAEIYTRVEAEWLEKLADGRWRVHYLARPDGLAAYRATVIARSVVVSAGALGSTQLLLRSKAQGLSLSNAVGTRFSANGDLLGFAYNTDVQTNEMGFGAGAPLRGMRRAGPTITMAAEYRGSTTPSDRFLIEEGAIPSALVDAVRVAMPALAGATTSIPMDQRMLRDLSSRTSDGALNHSLVYLGIGHDSASGRVELDLSGNAKVVWPGITSEPFVARMRSEMAKHAAVFQGRFLDSPRTSPIFGGAMTTVHPLGGVPMGDSASTAAVSADGRAYDPSRGTTHAGLYVVDGSTLPSSVGVNPLLTISALAERSASRFVG
jgi:cholesterol oxidase